MNNDVKTLTQDIRSYSKTTGISIIGFTNADPIECLPWSVDSKPENYQACTVTKIRDWVYDPQKILPGAKSIVITGMYMYGFAKTETSTPGHPRAKIGPWTRAYWEICNYQGEVISEYIKLRGYNAQWTNFLPYKSIAVKAGIGKIGNNGFLYTKEYGSYLELSCVLTDAELECTDNGTVSENDCGSCNLCFRSCPTGACQKGHEHLFDYDLCLHEWLQGKGKYKGLIPREERWKTGRYIMRTGECMEVCPRNINLKPRGPLPIEIEDKPDSPELIPLVLASGEEIKRMLPFHTYKYGTENNRKNAIMALGNIGDPAAIPALTEALRVMPAEIRSLSAWALGKIGGEKAYDSLTATRKTEKDPQVLEEIEAAIEMIEKNGIKKIDNYI